MMPGQDTSVTLDQMKGAVGSLLFLWSQIEKELADSLAALRNGGLSKPTHGIARTVDLWSLEMQQRVGSRVLAARLNDLLVAQLKEALFVRNLVCHGLVGITAQISAADQEAHLTVELGEVSRLLTWTELQTMFKWMSRARWMIRSLTSAGHESDPLKVERLLLDWEDVAFQR